MNAGSWTSLIALSGCLVLVLAAYRSQRIDGRKTLMMAVVWGTIFLVVAITISMTMTG